MSALSLLASQAAEVAPLATGTAPSIPWGRLILAFLFCIVIAVAAILFIRKRNGMPILPDEWRNGLAGQESSSVSATNKLQITQRLSVTPTSQLVVLKRGKQNYVLHLTNSSATEIDRYSDDAKDGHE